MDLLATRYPVRLMKHDPYSAFDEERFHAKKTTPLQP